MNAIFPLFQRVRSTNCAISIQVSNIIFKEKVFMRIFMRIHKWQWYL